MQLPAELISLKLEWCSQLFSAVDEGRHQMLASNPKSRERDCSLSSGHKNGEDVIISKYPSDPALASLLPF